MSGILLDVGLPTADTIVHNSCSVCESLLVVAQSDRSVVC